jgi:PKD repeat protein
MAIADPSILFMRYSGGYNLGESYYLASQFVGWQDVIVGDPLCNPYRNSVRIALSQSSGGTAVFTVTRTGTPIAPLTVYFTTSAGGASSSITIPTGQSSGQISVTVPLNAVSQILSVTLSADSNYIVGDANQSQATLPPIFLSDPNAVPNPASVTQSVRFTAMTGLGRAAWSWDFGDGVTANDSGQVTTVSHVYAVAGTYHITAGVSDNNGNAQSASFDEVVQAPPQGAEPLSVTRLDCRLRYDSNGRDILAITGSIPIHAGLYPAGALFTLDIGGILFSATIDKRGRGSVSNGVLTLIPKAGHRSDANSATIFKASFRSGSWSNTLMAAGIDPDQDARNIKMQLPVTVNFNGQIFSASVWISYTGSAGKHGSLTVLK